MIPELFELVTWADIHEGDHVWFMGNVMLVRDGEWSAYYDPGRQAYPMRPGSVRVPVRDESGTEFAPPVELAGRVARLLRIGVLEQNDDARATIAGALRALRADMLTRGADITDDNVWKPAKRALLLALIKLAQTELHGTTRLARNATGEGP